MNRFCFLFYMLLLVLPYPVKCLADDRSTFASLMDLADQMSKTDQIQAIEYAKKALDLSEKAQNPKMIAQAQMKLTSLCYDSQNLTKCIEYGKLCEPYFEKSGDVETLSSLYNILSNANFNIGNAEASDMYSDKSIELAEKHQILDVLFKQYYNRGAIAFYRGDYSYSTVFAFKALEVAKKSNQHLYIAYCYDLMGSLSKSIADYRKAINYFHLSLKIYLAEDNKMSIGQSYANLAMTHERIKQPDSVRLYYYKAMDYYREADSADGLAVVYTGLASYYQSESKLDSAQTYIGRSLKSALLTESTKDLFNSYNIAGNIYFEQGDYQKSIEYHRKALFLALQKKNKGLESIAKFSISQDHAAMKRFDSSYHYLLQSYAIDDSLRQYDEFQKRAYAFAEHNVKEQLEKEMESERIRRRLWMIIIGLCCIVIVILSVYIWSMIVRHKKIKSINAELNKYKSNLEDTLQDRTRELMLTEQQILNLSNNLPKGAIFRFAFENEHEGKLLYVSSGWEELTGESIDADENAVFFSNRIPPDDSRDLSKALAYAIKNHAMLDLTYRFYKNDNDMRWFHVRAVAIAGKDEMTYLDGYLVDETQEKHFEQELVAAKDKAEESDKLKSAFLANMSHEIRTPMNAIVGFSSLLAKSHLRQERLTSYLEIIHLNCQRLLHLIDDIVDISKIEADQLFFRTETVPISEIMTAVKDHFEPIIDAGFPHVELWIDEWLLNSSQTVHTDVFRLKQVFVHLIDNALKFTEKGFVRCGQLSEESDILHFFIMDTGIGIAPDYSEIIFQSFRKLDQYSDGTGLGLAIVRRVLLQMGGAIWVESELGVGSTFHITIPLNS